MNIHYSFPVLKVAGYLDNQMDTNLPFLFHPISRPRIVGGSLTTEEMRPRQEI